MPNKNIMRFELIDNTRLDYYNETCKSNLKALKRTLESYTCYKLDNDMITVVKNSIETIKDILNKENNTETIY